MEKNEKALSSKRTKHINIRYYFVTYRIEEDEPSLEWFPTADMIKDFMTKPTQGSNFESFRDQLMGFMEAQDPGPVNPRKDREDKVSMHGHKAVINASPAHK